MTNDELASDIRAKLLELESRIEVSGHQQSVKWLTKARVAHSILHNLGMALVDAGEISPNSVGGDKPPVP